MPTQGGSIRLFRIAGIEVFLHWSWFLVAIYEVQIWRSMFSSPVWAALLYLGLFVLVTMHEFGHALACRQVGGRADRIVLWPLGGIAFVNPPQRAGAMLWSIAAGPLVNVLLAAHPDFHPACRRSRRIGEHKPRRLSRSALDLADQPWSASLQSTADLSPRRRPDFARHTLVSVGANPQPLHCNGSWVRGRRRACPVRDLDNNRSGSGSWLSSFSARPWWAGGRRNT